MERKPLPRLLILDFDGTLADTRPVIVKTMQQTLAELRLPSRTEAQCAAMIGLPLHETFRQLLQADDTTATRCADTYRRLFDRNNRPEAVPLFPHVDTTLRELHRKGHVLTIASSRSHRSLAEYLERFALDGVMDCVLGADDVTRAKPHPEPVLLTLERTGISAAEAMVVGDTAYDVAMGLAAGVETCGVTYGNGTADELRRSGAHRLIDDFSQLLGL